MEGDDREQENEELEPVHAPDRLDPEQDGAEGPGEQDGAEGPVGP